MSTAFIRALKPVASAVAAPPFPSSQPRKRCSSATATTTVTNNSRVAFRAMDLNGIYRNSSVRQPSPSASSSSHRLAAEKDVNGKAPPPPSSSACFPHPYHHEPRSSAVAAVKTARSGALSPVVIPSIAPSSSKTTNAASPSFAAAGGSSRSPTRSPTQSPRRSSNQCTNQAHQHRHGGHVHHAAAPPMAAPGSSSNLRAANSTPTPYTPAYDLDTSIPNLISIPVSISPRAPLLLRGSSSAAPSPQSPSQNPGGPIPETVGCNRSSSAPPSLRSPPKATPARQKQIVAHDDPSHPKSSSPSWPWPNSPGVSVSTGSPDHPQHNNSRSLLSTTSVSSASPTSASVSSSAISSARSVLSSTSSSSLSTPASPPSSTSPRTSSSSQLPQQRPSNLMMASTAVRSKSASSSSASKHEGRYSSTITDCPPSSSTEAPVNGKLRTVSPSARAVTGAPATTTTSRRTLYHHSSASARSSSAPSYGWCVQPPGAARLRRPRSSVYRFPQNEAGTHSLPSSSATGSSTTKVGHPSTAPLPPTVATRSTTTAAGPTSIAHNFSATATSQGQTVANSHYHHQSASSPTSLPSSSTTSLSSGVAHHGSLDLGAATVLRNAVMRITQNNQLLQKDMECARMDLALMTNACLKAKHQNEAMKLSIEKLSRSNAELGYERNQAKADLQAAMEELEQLQTKILARTVDTKSASVQCCILSEVETKKLDEALTQVRRLRIALNESQTRLAERESQLMDWGEYYELSQRERKRMEKERDHARAEALKLSMQLSDAQNELRRSGRLIQQLQQQHHQQQQALLAALSQTPSPSRRPRATAGSAPSGLVGSTAAVPSPVKIPVPNAIQTSSPPSGCCASSLGTTPKKTVPATSGSTTNADTQQQRPAIDSHPQPPKWISAARASLMTDELVSRSQLEVSESTHWQLIEFGWLQTAASVTM